jgi:hypothetical protein
VTRMTKLWAWVGQTFTLENIGRLLYSIGGRRFLLTLLVGAATTVLTWYGKITDSIYRDVILGTVGIFIGGTTFQKNTQIKTTGSTAVASVEATGKRPETNPSE